jgi:uncharacterized membrane protein
MKYLKLITNKHCLAITAIGLLALLCIMATSEVTLSVIIVKAIGFGLIYLMTRLYKKWDKQGKVAPINELFNDNDEEIVI